MAQLPFNNITPVQKALLLAGAYFLMLDSSDDEEDED